MTTILTAQEAKDLAADYWNELTIPDFNSQVETAIRLGSTEITWAMPLNAAAQVINSGYNVKLLYYTPNRPGWGSYKIMW